MAGDQADPATEVVTWENPELAASFHHGGTLRFGPDGMLYVSTGDQFQGSNSQDLSNQHGKLLRLAPDGSIPADNPFAGVPGADPAIWAYGLRNPFRFQFDPLNGDLWIGDVGGNVDTSAEELNLGAAGANYGWPDQEGAACYASDCSAYVGPYHSYPHTDPEYYEDIFQGAILAGPVYRASAFPAPYRGNLFVGDYANRWIRRLVFSAGGDLLGDPLFLRPPEARAVVDLAQGPGGELFFLSLGLGNGNDEPALWRVVYTGGPNDAPLAVADAQPAAGPPPLAVQFSGAGSTDPDAGPAPLGFFWEFGDGATATEPDPLHVYAAAGAYQAVLTVSDGATETSAPPLAITVGHAPEVVIAAPAAGLPYRAGDAIAFSGSATDSEDGPLPPSALTWQVLLVHAGHTHPFLGPLAGVTQGEFTIPTSGHEPEDTTFEVQLSAVDSDGLVATAVHALQPVTSTLVIDTVPSGIPIVLDGLMEATPRVVTSPVSYTHLTLPTIYSV